MFQLKNLRYATKVLCDNNRMDFTLRSGEIHSILSARVYDLYDLFCFAQGNRSAKGGEVLLDGHPIDLLSLKKCIYTISNDMESSLFEDLSIAENLFLSSRCSSRQAREETRALFAAFGLPWDPDILAGELTGSQKKIIELLRGHIQGYRVYMLYDTIYHIDRHLQDCFIRLMRQIVGAGGGIIFLTAKVEDALLVSDRISVVESGAILKTFDAAQVHANPKGLMQLLTNLYDEAVDVHEMNQIIHTFLEMQEVSRTSTAVYKKLQSQLGRIAELMGADYCELCAEKNGRLSSVDGTEGLSASTLRDIRERIRALCADARDQVLWVEEENRTYVMKELSREAGWAKGYICLVFFRKYLPNDKAATLLSALAKEILYSLEMCEFQSQSVLLQESNHRIKNSFQMIVSMLYMQKKRLREIHHDIAPEQVAEVFDIVISRITSIALIHEMLSSGAHNMDNIVELSEMVDKLVQQYLSLNIQFHVESQRIMVPYDKAAMIGLIINELLNNCVKHAFTGRAGADNQVRIKCTETNDNLNILVADNGVGLSGGGAAHSGSGMQLLEVIVSSFSGRITFSGEQGATAVVRIPREGLYSVF